MLTECPGPHQRLVYSYSQAAEQISVCERSLRQMVKDGEIVAITYGEGRRRRGVTHAALLAWTAAREAEAEADGQRAGWRTAGATR